MLPLGPNTYNENETIAKYEIMDGAPVRGMIHASFLLGTFGPLYTLWSLSSQDGNSSKNGTK